MSGYKFTAAQRFAVYTIHGAVCYLNGEPLYLKTMRIDHVLPRSLKDDPERLSTVLKDYGLPRDFDLDSFENWLPTCDPCNSKKYKEPFRPAPIILRHIDQARSKAAKTKALAERIVTDQAVAKALNTIERALDGRQIDPSVLDPLIRDYRQATKRDETHEFRISPEHTAIYEGESYRIVRANYGVGFRPSRGPIDSSFLCPHCGNYGPWSGARCQSCGHLIQDD